MVQFKSAFLVWDVCFNGKLGGSYLINIIIYQFCNIGQNVEYFSFIFRSFEEEIEFAFQELEKKKDFWTLNIVRRKFIQTAMEELNEAAEEDWEKPLRVHFIGEEGIDSGGLRREFFTLLFKNTDIFEESSLRLDSNLLSKKQYKVIGKATALALINGHPGPCRLNKLLSKYIVTKKEPDAEELGKDDIDRADALSLLNEVSFVIKGLLGT